MAPILYQPDSDRVVKYELVGGEVIRQEAKDISGRGQFVKRLSVRGRVVEVYRLKNALFAVESQATDKFDYSGPVHVKTESGDKELTADVEFN